MAVSRTVCKHFLHVLSLGRGFIIAAPHQKNQPAWGLGSRSLEDARPFLVRSFHGFDDIAADSEPLGNGGDDVRRGHSRRV